jgi:hypothetical protein
LLRGDQLPQVERAGEPFSLALAVGRFGAVPAQPRRTSDRDVLGGRRLRRTPSDPVSVAAHGLCARISRWIGSRRRHFDGGGI